MAIHTVCGKINAEDIGISAMHEHLYCDSWTSYYSNIGDMDASVFQPLTLENYGLIRRNPGALRENLILTDVDLTIREVTRYRKAGGSLIVDATVRGAFPNPKALKEISIKTGIHVVAATGFYMVDTLPPEDKGLTASEMAELCIREIRVGFPETDIQAGIIGEVGAIGEMDENEKKILRATAAAQKETGAAVLLHTACPSTLFDSPLNLSWRERTHRVLDYMEAHGADLSRVIVGHADVSELNSVEDQLDILRRGIVLEYDNFGQEHPYDRENTYGITDWQRVKNILRLVEEGYGTSLVLSTDVWQKAQYAAYGGWGFDHIPTNIFPMLRKNGLTEEALHQISVLTPRRLLDF